MHSTLQPAMNMPQTTVVHSVQFSSNNQHLFEQARVKTLLHSLQTWLDLGDEVTGTQIQASKGLRSILQRRTGKQVIAQVPHAYECLVKVMIKACSEPAPDTSRSAPSQIVLGGGSREKEVRQKLRLFIKRSIHSWSQIWKSSRPLL